MFIKNAWYVAAELKELSHDTPLAGMVINQPLVLYRGVDGEPIVFEDRCCHRWAALSRGRIEGNDLRRGYHGFLYDATGRCIEIPGQAQIPEGAFVRRYSATVRYGWVWVWMGDPEAADLDLVPSTPQAEGYDIVYEGFSGRMDYAASYELINDNLTDFTSLSCLHSESFGASPEWAHSRPKVSALDRGIRIQRWIMDDTITPRVVTELAGQSMRNWTSMDYLAPGVLLMVAGAYTPEAHWDVDGGEPKVEPLHSQYNWQAVTPITETTSRYYFSWGVRRCENRPHIIPIMERVLHSAFAEDKRVIEAQQRIWNITGEQNMVGSTGDLGLHRMRKVIRRLLEAEGSLPAPPPFSPQRAAAAVIAPLRSTGVSA